MTTTFTYSQFLDIINKYTEYFKELEDLKEAGIDLTKLAAHSALYKIAVEPLFEKLGVECGLEILKFSEHPISTPEEFYSYLNHKYVFAVTERPDLKEFSESPKERKERKEVEQGKKKSFDPISAARDEEKKIKKPEKIYYVNGQKVSKEEYKKIFKEWIEFLGHYKLMNYEDLFGNN